MTRVNWRDMQTEELGSVYESLLELIPVVHLEARAFAFAAGDTATRGNERKTTGSYYTPDSQRPPPPVRADADVQRRERLGGLLSFY